MVQPNEQGYSEASRWPTKEFLAKELRVVLARYEVDGAAIARRMTSDEKQQQVLQSKISDLRSGKVDVRMTTFWKFFLELPVAAQDDYLSAIVGRRITNNEASEVELVNNRFTG